ncbi:MAG: DUF4270 family protein [Bacteroidia bacterium]|nr:DUF4270 family protein [Bacteroidia bacterium]
MLTCVKQPLLLAGLCLILLNSSCSEPDLIGLDLQPASEQPGVSVDTLYLETYTVAEDSLVMWSPLKNLIELPTLFLGSYDEPYMGKSFAGFVSQIRIGNTITPTTFAGATTPDSVVLSFLYKDQVGDTNVTHRISVYELTEKLYNDSTYYSARTYGTAGLLGHVDLVPEIKDSVVVGGSKAAPQLRIPLDTALGGKIMREYISNPGTFASNSAFIDFFKGVVLTDSADGVGSIVSMPSTSGVHRLTLYFSGNKSYEFLIDVNAVRMSYFKHQYLPSNNDQVEDQSLVVASMAGLKDSLVIKNLSSLYDDGPVSISSARLVIRLEDGTTASNFEPHSNLLIFGSDSTGKNVTTADATETSSYYGGAYDNTKNQYVLNVARYVQQTLKKVVENGGKDYGLFLVAGGSTSNARRTILKGQSSIQLIVTKTKFNP